ncbi:MAG: helix-turn-helix transcriptional regulator [Anderseniella sp.]|nr:helix-turn-helix transcriptional regulator [Anderseniella sp.]
MSGEAPVYLTTRELADLLRIKERKVYDMAAAGEVPCSRAMGKLLFPRAEVEAWLAASASGPRAKAAAARPPVVMGSHDPLLDWAVRESRCGLATAFDSSLDGLLRFAGGECIAAGLHLPGQSGGEWNVGDVRARASGANAVLVEWARRERGLVVAPGSAINAISGLAGMRFAPRQPEAGSQILFTRLASEAGLDPASLKLAPAARSETDAVLMVQEGKADACFGLACIAAQFRLGFVPLASERYDLLVDRKAWFDAPFQALLGFCQSAVFRARATEMAGYDVTGQFKVQHNQ